MNRKIEELLDDALTSVIIEQGSVESRLEEHPHRESQLRPSLDTAQWLHDQGKHLQPRPGFVQSSKQYLASELMVASLQHNFRYMPYRRGGFMGRLAAIFLIVVVIFAGAGGVVMAGSNALPGEMLYPARTAMENIWLALTLQPSRKAERHLQVAQDHLVACALLVSQGRYEDAQLALQQYETHMARAGRLIPTMSRHGVSIDLFFIEFNQILLQDIETIRAVFPGEF